jgi:hypothetical protein
VTWLKFRSGFHQARIKKECKEVKRKRTGYRNRAILFRVAMAARGVGRNSPEAGIYGRSSRPLVVSLPEILAHAVGCAWGKKGEGREG